MRTSTSRATKSAVLPPGCSSRMPASMNPRSEARVAGTSTCTTSSYATTETMSAGPNLRSAAMAPSRAPAIFSPCIDPDRSMARQTFTPGRRAATGAFCPIKLTRR